MLRQENPEFEANPVSVDQKAKQTITINKNTRYTINKTREAVYKTNSVLLISRCYTKLSGRLTVSEKLSGGYKSSTENVSSEQSG